MVGWEWVECKRVGGTQDTCNKATFLAIVGHVLLYDVHQAAKEDEDVKKGVCSDDLFGALGCCDVITINMFS